MKNIFKSIVLFSFFATLVSVGYACTKGKSAAPTTGGTWVAKQTTYTVTSTSRSGTAITFADGTHHTKLTCTFYGNIPTASGSYRIAYTPSQYGEIGIVFNDGIHDYVLDYYNNNIVTLTVSSDGKITLVVPSVEADYDNGTGMDTLTVSGGTIHEI